MAEYIELIDKYRIVQNRAYVQGRVDEAKRGSRREAEEGE